MDNKLLLLCKVNGVVEALRSRDRAVLRCNRDVRSILRISNTLRKEANLTNGSNIHSVQAQLSNSNTPTLRIIPDGINNSAC